MRVINLLQTWSVGGSLIVFGLWFQSCNTESLGNPVTPGTLPLLDNSTTVDNCSAYSDNALKPLSIRGEGKHEWESDIGSFVEGVLKDNHSLVDEKTTLYKGNNDPNDNYGHAIGWERMRSSILKALSSLWYELNFWCGDLEWILDEEYQIIQNKPKKCATKTNIQSGRAPLYRLNSDQGWPSIHSNIFP
ncbi:unnamed protein product [Aspergillus oryzae]|nr:unnamed protein product [Aspergillus oryzae]GMF84998.1 unnamed protein product [Aspergillus oryzae]